MHTSDVRKVETDTSGFFSPMRGQGQLAEHAANYWICYADHSEVCLPIRRRFQLGGFQRRWGENCFEAVVHRKPRPVRSAHEQVAPGWGWTQTRVDVADNSAWDNWLWAWENPFPEKEIVRLRIESLSGVVVLSAITAGNTTSNPLLWDPRRKAVLRLPKGDNFNPELDQNGLIAGIQLDLGQVISAVPRPIYSNSGWIDSCNNQTSGQI